MLDLRDDPARPFHRWHFGSAFSRSTFSQAFRYITFVSFSFTIYHRGILDVQRITSQSCPGTPERRHSSKSIWHWSWQLCAATAATSIDTRTINFIVAEQMMTCCQFQIRGCNKISKLSVLLYFEWRSVEWMKSWEGGRWKRDIIYTSLCKWVFLLIFLFNTI